MANDARDVTATSKPRGSYLDPLKACALSGENGVPAGKSESATFSKYNAIIKQSRRNATRASVLNDVERSRFESIVKRMENEHVYHTAVLDRQKRQFRKSLQVLEKDRRAVKRYFDRGGNWVATPLKLADGVNSKRNRVGERNNPLPPIDAVAAVQEANVGEEAVMASDDQTMGETAGKEVEETTASKKDENVSQTPSFFARRLQSMPAVSGEPANSMPKPPQRFYTGDDITTMRAQLASRHQDEKRDTANNGEDVAVQDMSASI